MKHEGYKKRIEKLQDRVSCLEEINDKMVKEFDREREVVNSALHEVRRFSSQLKMFSTKVVREIDGQYKDSVQQAAQSVIYISEMISARLAYMDIELNPNAIENQTLVRAGIYKKFDKSKRLLSEAARRREVRVNLNGVSRMEIEVLPIFELLPFVLLDNGIKYSPKGQSVDVNFDMVNDRQVVTVASNGPSVSEDEQLRLCDRRFRGSQVYSMPGEGLGLFLAKKICDYHDIKMRIEIPRRGLYQVQGVDYCEFRVVLTFP